MNRIYPVYADNLCGQMEEMQRTIKGLIESDFNFLDTPKMNDNPHLIDPPFIERLLSEKMQYEYKKIYERLTRARPAMNQWLQKLEKAEEIEKEKIIEAGAP